uniref:Uncharacterized protein n=1 Tax=Arundo donax TaxID=35708 RepID=A0A0A9CDN9_ARUDO
MLVSLLGWIWRPQAFLPSSSQADLRQPTSSYHVEMILGSFSSTQRGMCSASGTIRHMAMTHVTGCWCMIQFVCMRPAIVMRMS